MTPPEQGSSLAAMVTAFDERRKLITAGLNALPGVRCATPTGAFYAFPNITGTGIEARTLENRLLEEVGVATIAGTSFGAFGKDYLRFSYAADTAAIGEALARIKSWLERNARA